MSELREIFTKLMDAVNAPKSSSYLFRTLTIIGPIIGIVSLIRYEISMQRQPAFGEKFSLFFSSFFSPDYLDRLK